MNFIENECLFLFPPQPGVPDAVCAPLRHFPERDGGQEYQLPPQEAGGRGGFIG